MFNSLIRNKSNNAITPINSIKQISKIGSLSIVNNLYEKYLMHMYHFVMFDIVKNEEICKKIAIIFSNNPDVFLGDKRTEIQICNESVTLSLNDWVKCKSLPEYKIDYYVEYYIQCVNNFPVTIAFRIRKDIDEHKEKLNNFISCLTNDFDPDKKNKICELVTNPLQIKDEPIGLFIVLPENQPAHIMKELNSSVENKDVLADSIEKIIMTSDESFDSTEGAIIISNNKTISFLTDNTKVIIIFVITASISICISVVLYVDNYQKK